MSVLYLLTTIFTVLSILVMCVVDGRKTVRISHRSTLTARKYTTLEWFVILFCQGMGAGLIASAPTDIGRWISSSYITPILLWTLLAWSFYAMYGIWYMKHKEHKLTKWLNLLSYISGISVSLSITANYISNYLKLSPIFTTVIIITFVILLAFLSVLKELYVKYSIINMILFGCAMLLLLVSQKSIPSNFRLYENFFADISSASSIGTIAWWISWAPICGSLLADISEGISIRRYFVGSIFLPSLLTIFWMLLCTFAPRFGIPNYNAFGIFTFVLMSITLVMFMTTTIDTSSIVVLNDLLETYNKKHIAVLLAGLFATALIFAVSKFAFALNEIAAVPLAIFIAFIVFSYFRRDRKREFLF